VRTWTDAARLVQSRPTTRTGATGAHGRGDHVGPVLLPSRRGVNWPTSTRPFYVHHSVASEL